MIDVDALSQIHELAGVYYDRDVAPELDSEDAEGTRSSPTLYLVDRRLHALQKDWRWETWHCSPYSLAPPPRELVDAVPDGVTYVILFQRRLDGFSIKVAYWLPEPELRWIVALVRLGSP